MARMRDPLVDSRPANQSLSLVSSRPHIRNHQHPREWTPGGLSPARFPHGRYSRHETDRRTHAFGHFPDRRLGARSGPRRQHRSPGRQASRAGADAHDHPRRPDDAGGRRSPGRRAGAGSGQVPPSKTARKQPRRADARRQRLESLRLDAGQLHDGFGRPKQLARAVHRPRREVLPQPELAPRREEHRHREERIPARGDGRSDSSRNRCATDPIARPAHRPTAPRRAIPHRPLPSLRRHVPTEPW